MSNIHLKTLSDMTDHPLVNEPLLTYILPWIAGKWSVRCIQLFERLLGVLFIPSNHPIDSRLVFWDWKCGTVAGLLVTDTVICSFDSFSLMAEDVFGLCDSRGRCIHTLSLEEPRQKPRHLMSFQLPQLLSTARYESIKCTRSASSSVRYRRLRRDSLAPFCAADESRILVFVLEIELEDATGMMYIVSPISTFLSGHSSAPGASYLPWEAWGPQFTRVLPCPGEVPTSDFAFVSGSRMALLPELSISRQGRRDPEIVSVFDFNQPQLRRGRRAAEGRSVPGDISNNLDDEESAINWSPSTFRNRTVFTDDITTNLPYRRMDMQVGGEYLR